MKHDLPADLEADAAASNSGQPSADAPSAPAAPAGPTAGASEQPPASGSTPYATAPRDRDAHGGASHGFFAWLRGLGIERQPGWIGGVAAGIAARIGIDPIIVRGILVVLAIFAAPALLFYGIAWLLLPDTEGRIHAQRLTQGDPQPALAGIAVFVLFGLFTPNPSLSNWNPLNWHPFGGSFLGSGSSIAGAFVSFCILAALTIFVVWLVRRSSQNSRSGGAASQTASASPTAASGTNGGGYGSGGPDAAATTGVPIAAGAAVGAASTTATAATATATAAQVSTGAGAEPISPGATASVDELAAWKLQHEAWRTERERFNTEQANADRAARAQWAAENKARSQEFAAQAAEHRTMRKLQRPRVSAAAIFFTLGVALVAGAVSAFLALGLQETDDYAPSVGLLVAALVAATAMIIAGIARRRSGFLAFVTVVLLLLGMGSALLPRDGALLAPGQVLYSDSDHGAYVQPWGGLGIWIFEDKNQTEGTPREITVSKANGDVTVYMMKGTTLSLSADLAPGDEITGRVESSDGTTTKMAIDDPTGQSTVRLGQFEAGHVADLTLNADLGNGSVHIIQYVE